MYTKGTTIDNALTPDFVVPPLSKEAVFRLPKYCPKPTKNNLATQYYYWSLELQKENRKLQQENKQLKEEKQKLEEAIRQLKEKNAELKGQRDRFLKMIFKPKRKRKKTSALHPVRQPRSKQSYIRQLPQHIDEQKKATLKCCPCCQNKLSKQLTSYQRIIEDIPCFEEQRAKVVQYTIYRYYCKKCQKIVSAKPLEVLPKSRLGINTLLYVLHAKYRSRLSQELIRDNLETYFNLKVSKGEINNLLNKGSEVFKEKWQEVIEIIKHSKAVNADETSWGHNWLWAFAADKAVRYTISEFRGKGVPQKVLGRNYSGVVGCDFYPAYNQFKKKQRCWVHLLRRIKELVEREPTPQRKQTNTQLKRIYQQILFFRSQPGTTKKQRAKKAKQIEEKLLTLSRIKTSDEQLQKVLNLCGKYAGELVVCVYNPHVFPDNNRAERAIRPAVVMRKISGSSRSKKGALTHETNLSVIETLRKEEKPLFPAMKELVLKHITSNG